MRALGALVLVPLCIASACAGDAGEGGAAPDGGGALTDASADADSPSWWFDAGKPDSDGGLIPCGGNVQSGCTWTVPLASNGQPADPNNISIRLRDSEGKETALVHVSDASACTTATLGWYATPGEAGAIIQLVACPETCSLISATDQQVIVLPGCVDPQR